MDNEPSLNDWVELISQGLEEQNVFNQDERIESVLKSVIKSSNGNPYDEITHEEMDDIFGNFYAKFEQYIPGYDVDEYAVLDYILRG